jgi:hypothetical protein
MLARTSCDDRYGRDDLNDFFMRVDEAVLSNVRRDRRVKCGIGVYDNLK